MSVSLFSLEHFFEWLTHLSPLLSKATHLSTFLSKPTRLSTFLSTQKSRFALESTFLSGFTLLSAFLSAQKSAQGPAEPTSFKSSGNVRIRHLGSRQQTVVQRCRMQWTGERQGWHPSHLSAWSQPHLSTGGKAVATRLLQS